MNKYRVEKVLGEGAFGQVLKALNKETGEFVAIKHIKVAAGLPFEGLEISCSKNYRV